MKTELRYSVVVPVYNEAAVIGEFCAAARAQLPFDYELLICYDFDGDNTLPAVANLPAERKPDRIRFIRNTLGPGVRYAIEAGMKAAAAPVVVVTMADGSDEFAKVGAMVERAEAGAAVVCGSRYMKGGAQIGGPRLKKFLSRSAGLTLKWFTGLPTHDPTNSFKAYRREFLDATPIESTAGFCLGLEMTVKAHAAGRRIDEVPAVWRDRSAGQSRFRMWKWMPHYLQWYLAAFRTAWLGRKGVLVTVALLLILRGALAIYGFDRLPVVTSNDEIYWAEPAWSLTQGTGYRMPCAVAPPLSEFYAHHPPIYPLILAGGFQTAGLSPSTLRLASLLAHLVCIVLLFVLLRRLRRLKIIDDIGFLVGCGLVITNFSTFYLSRWGRPDPVCLAFVVAGFVVLFSGSLQTNRLFRRGVAAAVFIGLALATHTIAAIYFAIFVFTILVFWRRLGWVRVGIIAAVAPAVFFAIWWATFGPRSLEALQVHRQIVREMKYADASAFRPVIELSRGNLQGVLQAGGTTSLLLLALPLWALGRWMTDRWLRAVQKPTLPWQWLAASLVFAVGLVLLFSGLTITRGVILFPLAAVCCALLVARDSGWSRRIALVAVAGLTLIDVGQIGFVTLKVHREWAQRSPARFDPWLDRIAAGSRVAVSPALWYQCRVRGFDVRLVDTSLPALRRYWTTTDDVFADTDVVILPVDHELAGDRRLQGAAVTADIPEVGRALRLYVLNPGRFSRRE